VAPNVESPRPHSWNKGDLLLREGRGRERREEKAGEGERERKEGERMGVSLNFP